MIKAHKIINLFCFLLVIVSTAFSQESGFQVLNETKVLGKNYINGADIVGTELIFSDKIHDFFIDTTSHFLTVQLRGISSNGKWLNNTGNMLQYDLINKKLLWNKSISYLASSFLQCNKILIHSDNYKSYCIDAYTGKSLWDKYNQVLLIDSKQNIAIGYRYHLMVGLMNYLEGIDVKTGETIWERKLRSVDKWYAQYYINDSTLIVSNTAGLHTININTGKGWDYLTSTTRKNNSELVSNVLSDSTSIYLASQEQMAKIDKQSGNILWKYRFQYDWSGVSSILMDDTVVYMVNKGIAFKSYCYDNYGKVFIAAFDKQTGKLKYLTLTSNRDGSILDFKILDYEIYLLFQNKIAKYDLKTGAFINEKEFHKKIYGKLKYFFGNHIFIVNENRVYSDIAQNNSAKLHFYLSSEKILSIDSQLNVTNTSNIKDICINYLHYKNYTFIAKIDENTFVINNDGKIIAELNVSSNAFLLDDILYDKRNNSFIAIDFKNFNK